ncbi:Tlg2-vesicle protein [Microbotryomycetes sp. JL201]|nr:Tlg2-vesicle protein [Microbotryomycetes sp. JL201]
MMEVVRQWNDRLQQWWDEQPRSHQIALLVWSAFQVAVFIAALWIGPVRMFEILAEWADGLREMRFGWLLLLMTIIITSVPPLLGYGTAQTLCGFAFGVINGWLLGAAGCLIGGCFAFLLTRRLIEYYAPMLKSNSHFQALSKAVKHKGLPLIVLIRLCPFSFPYSNAFFAAVESVSVFQFFIATLAITPKLLLHAWIGQRMYLFADPTSRHSMDPQAKRLNAIFIAVGTILGFAVSYYLYKMTMRYVEEANQSSEDDDREYEDLEAGGRLMDDVDDMLDEDEHHRASTTQTSNGTRLATVYTDDSPALDKRRKETEQDDDDDDDEPTPRQSTDNWDGLSDFGEDAGRRKSIVTLTGDDEDGAWGLELDPVDEAEGEHSLIDSQQFRKERRD